MNNRILFRVLGAFFAALIIVAVFVPYVSVTGYSYSLLTYLKGSQYLPIMIVVFGAIAVLLFALGTKTEFTYASVGAVVFFLVNQTIEILNQGSFGSLGMGYYLLIAGTLGTCIMTFLYNMKSKNEHKDVVAFEESQPSMLNQIDNLYNGQLNSDSQVQVNTIQPVEQVNEGPMPVISPVQPVEQPIPVMSPVQPVEQVNEGPIPVISPVQPAEQPIPVISPIQPVEQVTEVKSDEQPVSTITDSVNYEFKPVNPVLEQFREASNLEPIQPVEQPIPVISPVQPVEQPTPVINPTVEEFTQPQATSMQPTNDSNTNIFGQPLK